jgi:arabinofuranosyltransferase
VAARVRRIDPSLALALLPVATLVVVGWDLRWVNEDGFIYFRVVDHLLAGDGPVFNAGERIEAYTSPAWLALLAVGAALLPLAELEWISVCLGVAMSAGGLVAACAGALRLQRALASGSDDGRLLLPLGALVVAAVPAFWGFVTSGLETSLAFGWLGGCFLGLARLLTRRPVAGAGDEPDAARTGEVPRAAPAGDAPDRAAPGDGPGAAQAPGDGPSAGGAPPGGERAARTERAAGTERPARTDRTACRPTLLALLIGLGPLVRPDLVPFAACFLAALLVVARPLSRRRAALLIVAALAAPVLYQVFRMGYFAALVPSTALAKEAGLAYWERGLGYLGDIVLTYALWLPLPVLGWLWWRSVAPAWRERRLVAVAVAVAPLAGALLHTLYIVRLGGDYMHGRMLLPSLFAVLMPVAVVALPRRRAVAVGVVALLIAWAGVCAVALRAPSQFGPEAGRWQVLDQRAKQKDTPSHPHPVTLADHDALPLSQPRVGYEARSLARAGPPRLLLDARIGRRRTADGVVPVQVPLPLDVDADRRVTAPVIIFTGSIGRLGYAAGREVRIADRLGLADPVAARLRLPPERPDRAGHEKLLPAAWFLGRFADPASVRRSTRFRANPRIPAARAALGCGRLGRLLDAVDAPLTPRRFAANLGASFELHSLRVPADPLAARRELCGR